MKTFYIKDIRKAKQYGFFEDYEGMYVWRRKGVIGMYFYKKDKLLSFPSASRDAIALVCEMYKNGIIKIQEVEKHG